MRDEISLKITNLADTKLIYTTFSYLKERLPVSNLAPLEEALRQLIENVLEHAYERNYDIDLTVYYYIYSCQLKIEVEDIGIPFDFSRYLSEPVDHSADHKKGFYRIYDLVDRFYFTPLPNAGKCFTLIQMFDKCFDIKTNQIIAHESLEKEDILQHLTIRAFEHEDGDGIAKLIYKNYDYTYYKHLFYVPEEVRKVNEKGDVHSVVAIYHNEIVGHFALVRAAYSNIAEIAVATVEPRYKGMGIMNKMFDFLIFEAQRLGYDAIFGEAIMLHPYSQKANLTHGMTECAIVLGQVPSETQIEHNVKILQRSGVLIAYLLFDKRRCQHAHSKIYGKQIQKIYDDVSIEICDMPLPHRVHDTITHRIDDKLNLGYIRIDDKIEEKELIVILTDLQKEHCDMLYADINLHRIPDIDTVIVLLNSHGFFYSGVLFSSYESEDYLRLQRKNSKSVDEDHLVYYSKNAQQMITFIREDEERINRL
jgi:anti-sigma regulatory factor (Ser/Thr protein kinase)/N-acetylglutamate synthase-like GNAT family acetyltransferase